MGDYTEGLYLTTHSGSKTIKLLEKVKRKDRQPWMLAMNSRSIWWYATVVCGKGVNKQVVAPGKLEPGRFYSESFLDTWFQSNGVDDE